MKKFVRGLAILLAAIFAATGVPAAQIFAAEEEPLVRTEAQDLLKEDSGAASVNRLLETKWTENDFASSSEDLSAMGGSGEAANGQDGEASVAGVSDEGNSDGADTVSDQSVSDDKEEPTADNDKNLSNDGNNNDEDLSEERISGNDEDLSPDEDADGSNKNSDEDSEKGKGSDEEKVNDKNKLNPEGEQSKTADPEDAQSKAADTKGEQSKTADTEKSEDNDNLLSQKEETVSDGTNAVPEEQTENTVPTQEPEVPLTDKQPPVLASAGRAVLALPAGFLLAAALDNTTTLDDGEYTEFEFGWAGGTGKARLTLEKIVVKNGKATGVFTASSANMTHVYYLGHTSTDADDPTYYNPSTGACGTGVLPISNQSVEFPVALNEQTNIACRTVAMSAPHWVNYNYTITIEEPEPKPDLADYTAVDQALAKAEKIDRSIYTADSLAVLDKAVKAVVRDLPESKQKKVDAMAKAIEDAIAGLVLDIDDEKIDLKVTNNTGFLNVDSAYVQKEEEDIYLYLILTDGAFRNLFKGTFEQAVKNGDKTGRWISGTQDKDKKWEFKIPVAAGESFMNFAAIQQAAYKNYLAGKTPIERAFYPGQLTLNLKNETLNLSEYFSSLNLTVNNRATKVLPKSAVLTTQKGPNSPDYSCMLSLTMEDKAFDQLFIGTAKQAEKASAQNIYNLNKKTFEVPARWMASAGKPETMETIIGSPVTLSFHSAEYGIWYERVVTIDEQKAEILFKNEQKTADYHAVNLAVQEAEAVNRELYTAKSLKALDKAVA
ncbi:MAG: hypothetical protein IKF90_00865, partial [Parasporobacterium sp.]|nr:hypothetical protein [Parasporobacterium sp.]